jgi:hypothetical protein
MKITIQSNRPVKQDITIYGIAEKLNNMVGDRAGNFRFFNVSEGNSIGFNPNSNADLHTKLVCILGLYLGSLHKKHSCFLSVGYKDGSYLRLGNLPLNEFADFLDSLGDLRQVTFSIDN